MYRLINQWKVVLPEVIESGVVLSESKYVGGGLWSTCLAISKNHCIFSPISYAVGGF